MTNKATEQDKEAESVDNNEITMTKNPDKNKDMTAQDGSDSSLKSTTDETAEVIETAESEPAENNDFSAEEPDLVVEEIDNTAVVPGSLSRALKKCRDEADISLSGAAEEMRLPVSVVKALEEENFSDLPDPPYVRGYLRSYARLNESDPNDLINRYEILRGADPKDIASFTPVTPRYQPNSKKALSPTTVKLAGFSLIILLLVVLSMIPVVSQWASDTWQSFSEPQNQRLAATAAQQAASENNTETSDVETSDANTGTDQNTQQTAANNQQNDNTNTSGNNDSTDTATSSGDTATPDSSDQLAPDQNTAGATDTDTPAASDNTDSMKVADQGNTSPAQTDTATNTSDTATPAENTDGTQTSSQTAEAGDTDSANPAEAAEDSGTEEGQTTETAAATATDTDESAISAKKAAAEAARQKLTQEKAKKAAAEAARQKLAQEKAKKAAAAKAAADKLAAQQQEPFKQPIDGTVLIRMVFTQPVWMSIKDARGKKIFAELSSAGSRKELRASTPLQFRVGNAPGVQIYLNGQLVDQKPHTRGSVSNFRAN